MAGAFKRFWKRMTSGVKRVFDDPTRQQLAEAGVMSIARAADPDITEDEIDRLEGEYRQAITSLRNLKEAK